METIIRWDQELFLWLNSLHNPFFDELMWYVSRPMTWFPLYLLLLYLCIRHFHIRTLYVLLATAILIAITDVVSVRLFKEVFERLRPTHDPAIRDHVHMVRDYAGGTYGFISSHAANYFGLAGFFSVLFHKKVRNFTVAVMLCAALIAYSRIYLGVHYPGDVLCGAAVGAGIGLSLGSAFRYLDRRVMQARSDKNSNNDPSKS